MDDEDANVTFDFDPKTDNPLRIAKELQDANTVPNTLPMEDLHRIIERAIITRCRQIANERSMTEKGRALLAAALAPFQHQPQVGLLNIVLRNPAGNQVGEFAVEPNN